MSFSALLESLDAGRSVDLGTTVTKAEGPTILKKMPQPATPIYTLL